MTIITCECGKRLKAQDEWAGRRVRCPDCGAVHLVSKAEQAEPSGQPAEGDRDASMARRCCVCETDYPSDVLICVECGINLLTGEQYTLSVERISEHAAERAGSEKSSFRATPTRFLLVWSGENLPGLFRPLVLLCALLLAAIGLSIVVLGIVLLMGFMVVMGGGACMALGSLAYAQALAFIISGEFETLVTALVDFDGTHWTVFFSLLMAPGAVLLIFAKHFAET